MRIISRAPAACSISARTPVTRRFDVSSMRARQPVRMRAPARSASGRIARDIPCLAPLGQPVAHVLVSSQPDAARGTSCPDHPIASMPRENTCVLFGHALPRSETWRRCSAHSKCGSSSSGLAFCRSNWDL